MKYTLKRQLISNSVMGIVSREARKQKSLIYKISKKHLQGLASVLKAVELDGLPKHLVYKKLSDKLGYGIFLHPESPPILKGELIGPYAGIATLVPQNAPNDTAYAFELLCDIRLNKEEQTQLNSSLAYHPRRLYSLQVDALKQGNFIRFVNHSETPNVEARLTSTPATNDYNLDPMPVEILYVAKKTIHPGEQLLISYENEEKSYWGNSKIKPFPMTPKTFMLSPTLKVVHLS